jgi:type IX secretion system PorP/SprF family membrane protein
LYKLNSNVGFHVLNDRIGLMRSTYFAVDYAYNLRFKQSQFSFGLAAGFIQANLRASQIRTPDGNYDGGVNHNDDLIPNTDQGGLAPDVSVGIFYQWRNLRIGVSTLQLLNSQVNISDVSGTGAINYSRTFVSYVDYEFNFGTKFSLRPAVAMKTDFKQIQMDYQAIFGYNDRFFAGLGYRGYNNPSNDAVMVLIGFKVIRNLQVNYSYDATTSELNGFSNGSHELSAHFRLKITDKTVDRGKIIYNPRFL